MSEQTKKKKKKRKTRLKGTETHKPCVDCGQMKDRFADFKPRWAGCENHRTPRGRRYYEQGCVACAKIVNGNIRQPRCSDCDRSRTKKGKKAATPTPTPTPVQVDPNPTIAPAPADEFVEAKQPEQLPEPEPVVERTPGPEPEPEPVVEAKDEPSTESEDVTPEPSSPKQPEIRTTADILKMFGGE